MVDIAPTLPNASVKLGLIGRFKASKENALGPGFGSLIATCNVYGKVAYCVSKNSIRIHSVEDAVNFAFQNKETVDFSTCAIIVVPGKEDISGLEYSTDGNTLVVVCKGTFHLYNTSSLVKGCETQALFHSETVHGSKPITSFAWNPSIDGNTFLTCVGDGENPVKLWEISSASCKEKCSGDTRITGPVVSVRWTWPGSKGAQFVCGKKDGTIFRLTAELALNKTQPVLDQKYIFKAQEKINAYPGCENTIFDRKVNEVAWLSAHDFFMVHGTGMDSCFVSVHAATKNAPEAVANCYYDEFFELDELDCMNKTFFELVNLRGQQQPGWDLAVVACSISRQINLLGKDESSGWKKLESDDFSSGAFAELPIVNDEHKVYPVGLTIDQTNESKIIGEDTPAGDGEGLPASPRLLLLDSGGFVSVYHIANTSDAGKEKYPFMVQKKPQPSPSVTPKATVPASFPTPNSLTSKKESSSIITNPTTLPDSSSQGNKKETSSMFGNLGMQSTSFPLSSSPSKSIGSTSTNPTTFPKFNLGETSEKVSEPSKPNFDLGNAFTNPLSTSVTPPGIKVSTQSILGSKLPENTSDTKSANIQKEIKMPSNSMVTKDATSPKGHAQKITRDLKVWEAELVSKIDDFTEEFEKELNLSKLTSIFTPDGKLKVQRDKSIDEQIDALEKECEKIDCGIKESRLKIQPQELDLNECKNLLADAARLLQKHNPRYTALMKSRPLDPLRKRKLEQIHRNIKTMNFAMEEANSLLTLFHLDQNANANTIDFLADLVHRSVILRVVLEKKKLETQNEKELTKNMSKLTVKPQKQTELPVSSWPEYSKRFTSSNYKDQMEILRQNIIESKPKTHNIGATNFPQILRKSEMKTPEKRTVPTATSTPVQAIPDFIGQAAMIKSGSDNSSKDEVIKELSKEVEKQSKRSRTQEQALDDAMLRIAKLEKALQDTLALGVSQRSNSKPTSSAFSASPKPSASISLGKAPGSVPGIAKLESLGGNKEKQSSTPSFGSSPINGGESSLVSGLLDSTSPPSTLKLGTSNKIDPSATSNLASGMNSLSKTENKVGTSFGTSTATDKSPEKSLNNGLFSSSKTPPKQLPKEILSESKATDNSKTSIFGSTKPANPTTSKAGGGSPNPPTNIFGGSSSAQKPSGFGTPSTSTASSGFGASTSGFGSSTTTGFGQKQSGFGTSSTGFGGTQPNPQTPSAFGQGNASMSGFGNQGSTAGTFGSSPQKQGTFGSGGFGQSSGFGGSSTPGFGSPAGGADPFGASKFGQVPSLGSAQKSPSSLNMQSVGGGFASHSPNSTSGFGGFAQTNSGSGFGAVKPPTQGGGFGGFAGAQSGGGFGAAGGITSPSSYNSASFMQRRG
eukprot:m.151642 g.151642  ORF g.151642 m.151642 type:complete len:1366 (-) comp15040_c0_seq12:2576-6673(-)